MNRITVVILGWLILSASAHAGPDAVSHEDDRFLYHWEEVHRNGKTLLASTYRAPAPFSMTGEPEATLAVDVAIISPGEDTLEGIVANEVSKLRKTVLLAEYMEEDGRKSVHGIATWYETIEGTRVAFIKYRGRGVIGEPAGLPRTAIHTIFIKTNRVVFTHLIVLFAGHQDEDRRDQRRLVRTMIETAPGGPSSPRKAQ